MGARRARRRHRLPTAGVEYGVAVGLLYGVSSLAIKGVSGHLTTRGLQGAAFGLLCVARLALAGTVVAGGAV